MYIIYREMKKIVTNISIVFSAQQILDVASVTLFLLIILNPFPFPPSCHELSGMGRRGATPITFLRFQQHYKPAWAASSFSYMYTDLILPFRSRLKYQILVKPFCLCFCLFSYSFISFIVFILICIFYLACLLVYYLYPPIICSPRRQGLRLIHHISLVLSPVSGI